MKALLITEKGMEDSAKKEVKELVNASGRISDRVVVFEVSKAEELYKLCYLSQSASKIIELYGTFSFSNLSKDLPKLTKLISKSGLPKRFTFKVRCRRIGEHGFGSLDIEKEAGAILAGIFKDSKVVMENPDIIFYIFLNDDAGYFGADVSGKDLSKRNYKIFNHPQALKGPLGFHLAMKADVKPNEVVVDPFCGSGVIPIECALYLKRFPVRFYDKSFPFKYGYADDKKIRKAKLKVYCFDREFHYVSAAKKNAKIAGVDKDISFSRSDVEWLDTKLDKDAVDKIITHPPQPSKHTELKELQKAYDELFYQADFVLKKRGKIIMLCNEKEMLAESAKKKNFKLASESEVWQGSQKKLVLEFRKV